MNSILKRYPDLRHVYLLVNQGGVFPGPTVVQTVLGSCVSVTFHCPATKVGAIFHALLPHWKSYESQGAMINQFKYVDSSIDYLLRILAQRDIAINRLQCKVFGGAGAMFQGEAAVGGKNVAAALETLESHGLKVQSSSTGGNLGRKLFFITHTGEVLTQSIKSQSLGKEPRNQRNSSTGKE